MRGEKTVRLKQERRKRLFDLKKKSGKKSKIQRRTERKRQSDTAKERGKNSKTENRVKKDNEIQGNQTIEMPINGRNINLLNYLYLRYSYEGEIH